MKMQAFIRRVEMMVVLVAAVAAVLAAAAWTAVAGGWPSSQARAAQPEPALLQPDGELGSPFVVNWLDVGSQEVVVSDLNHGVAALRRGSGVVAWSRRFEGPIKNVWAVGDFVVVAADELVVLKRTIGTRAWRRNLRCEGGGDAPCVSVLAVNSEGILVASGGAIHNLLARLNLQRGEVVWKQGPVDPFRRGQVTALGQSHVALVQSALAPWGVAAFDWNAGTPIPLPPWPLTAAKARPSDAIHPVVDSQAPGRAGGAAVFVDRRPRAGAWASAWRLSGQTYAGGEITRPAEVKTHPIWSAAGGGTAWFWAPDPEKRAGALVQFDVLSRRVSPVRWLVGGVAPVAEGDTVVVAYQSGEGWRLLGLSAVDGKQRFDLALAAGEAPRVWRAGDGLVAVTMKTPGSRDDAPRLSVWSVDPETGLLLAFGQAPAEAPALGRGAVVAGPDGGTFAASGRLISQLSPTDLGQAEVALAGHLRAGRQAEAAALLARLAPLAAHSAMVRRMQDRLSETGVLTARRHFVAKAWAEGLSGAAGLVTAAGGPEGFADACVSAAGLVGEFLFGAKGGRVPRLSDDAIGALAQLARALTAGAQTHQLALTSADAGHSPAFERQGDVQAALMVVAAALARLGEPMWAADLLEVVTRNGWARDGALLDAYSAMSMMALADLYKDVGPALRGSSDNARKEASSALRLFKHGAAALGDARFIERRLEALDDLDPAYARESAKALDIELRSRMQPMKASLARGGLGGPACVVVCRALTTVCHSPCRSEGGCAMAGDQCARKCAGAGKVSWVPAMWGSGPQCN